MPGQSEIVCTVEDVPPDRVGDMVKLPLPMQTGNRLRMSSLCLCVVSRVVKEVHTTKPDSLVVYETFVRPLESESELIARVDD